MVLSLEIPSCKCKTACVNNTYLLKARKSKPQAIAHVANCLTRKARKPLESEKRQIRAKMETPMPTDDAPSVPPLIGPPRTGPEPAHQ